MTRVPVRRSCCIGLALAVVAPLVGCGGEASPGSTPVPPVVLEVVTATVGPPSPRTPVPAAGRRYVVREGDTLSAIAARFDVTEEALLRANDLTDPDRLLVGQELIIPPPEP